MLRTDVLRTKVDIGTPIDADFIENIAIDVEIIANEWGSVWQEDYAKNYSADGDEDSSFQEALNFATETHFYMWRRDIHESIRLKIPEYIESRLNEAGLYGTPTDIDTTRCGYHIELEPKKITHQNKDTLEQCLYDAAHDINWTEAESLQLFFQTTNPCCWDDKSPKERYGKEWIENTQTRLITMIYDIDYDLYKKCCDNSIKGSTLSICDAYIIETDYDGNETYHPCPPIDTSTQYTSIDELKLKR